SGIRAFAEAAGLPADSTVAGPLYLAARAMPHGIARAKTAVPAESHGAGLQVGHASRQLRPVHPGEIIDTTTSATTRETTAGTLVTVLLDTRSAGEVVATQRSTYLFRRNDVSVQPHAAGQTGDSGQRTL